CSSWSPPKPVDGMPGAPPPDTPSAADRDDPSLPPPARFAKLRERILDQWQDDEPSRGRSLGLHDYDGRVADYSADSMAKRLERNRSYVAALAQFDPKDLSPDDALDRALLQNTAELQLFYGDDVDAWHKNPRAYEDLFAVNQYLDRDYAPIEE